MPSKISIGFKTSSIWKKIVAIVYYSFLIALLFGAIIPFFGNSSLYDKTLNYVIYLLYFAGFVLPLIVEANKAKIRMRFNIFKKYKSFIWVICFSVLFVIVVLSSSLTAFHSTEFNATAKTGEQDNRTPWIQTDQTNVPGTINQDIKLTQTDTIESIEPVELLETSSIPSSTSVTASTLSQPIIKPTVNGSSTLNSDMSVHFIDVGQADCILIKQGTSSMLIDAGNNADAPLVVSYLQKQGIKSLDYVVGTHPHEDHIGGLDNIIKSFDVGKVILPNAQNNTQTFEDLLLAIQSKGLKITKPQVGQSFQLGSTSFQILAPIGTSYADLNNYSVVIRLSYGSTSFLFMGDAEFESESQILSKGTDIHADVLKVGHHGSNSSSSPIFLKAVSPQNAIISVGNNNTYGHPTDGTLGNLLAVGINIFRTDMSGTIIATSNGIKVSFNVAPNAGLGSTSAIPTETSGNTQITTKATSISQTTTKILTTDLYIGNINSLKFHLTTCGSLPYPENRVLFSNREAAINAGYIPCKLCNP